MRDALSLLDQAIAHGNGEVREIAVRAMLGAVDKDYLYRIAAAVAAGDGRALLGEIDAMSERSIDFEAALAELASLYHRIAVAQTVPAAAGAFDDAERITAFASGMTPEATQLAYQICVQGGADLALAPDAATGFSMALLRLLAFEPGNAIGGQDGERAAVPAKGSAPAPRSASPPSPMRTVEPAKPRIAEAPKPAAQDTAKPTASPADFAAPTAHVALPDDATLWPEFVRGLTLPPMAAQLAAQAELKSIAGHVLTLALPATHKHLADRAYSDKLKSALEQATGRKLLLAFEVGVAADSSLAAQERRARAEEKAKAEAAFRDEPFVRDVLERFDAKIRPDSVKPAS
jgi:DNA polymerase-3 subunit gamma/tau